MYERTGWECTYLFCEYVIEFYRDIYLRHPTKSDVKQLYVVHQAKHGFPWMLCSIDCTHLEWANCPNAWRGQLTRGDHGVPTVILEAVFSNDLWFWHAFFGMAGNTSCQLDILLKGFGIQNRKTHHNLRHHLNEYIWKRQFQGQNNGNDKEDDNGDEEEDGDGDEEEDEDDDNETDDAVDDNDD
uniref:Uncharacterized protein n=1 Tax=Lactuca sativa TaxID=4236 RepID=A0A9R1VJT4_LACSA|nr:hypothetical protein LSAT_V11C500229770 [Lactuca sativa]